MCRQTGEFSLSPPTIVIVIVFSIISIVIFPFFFRTYYRPGLGNQGARSKQALQQAPHFFFFLYISIHLCCFSIESSSVGQSVSQSFGSSGLMEEEN